MGSQREASMADSFKRGTWGLADPIWRMERK